MNNFRIYVQYEFGFVLMIFMLFCSAKEKTHETTKLIINIVVILISIV